jgi:pimeloyl-ACP methyl ester carboxylesterase
MPAAVECAQMQVPMDYATPDGPTITLGLARLPATDPDKRIGSLVFNPGGPGEVASEILGLQALYGAPFTARLHEYFDLVAFDPRGVGLSTPIQCDPQIWNEGGSLFPQDQAAYDAMVAHNRAFGASCLEATGPALAFMDTISVARDLDAVRAALGEEKLNYFGLSYGTMVGAQYAELFPERIRVMALDGALDHSQSENAWHFVEVKAYEQVFERFAAWCGQSPDCALNGKDVLQEFAALTKEADTTPIPAPDCVTSGTCRTTVTGDDIRAGIQGIVLNTSKWPELGEGLAKALAGDASAFAVELKSGPIDMDFAETAIQCLDWPAETNATFDGLQARRIFDLAAAPYTQGATQSWRAQTRCVGWPVPMTNPPRPLVVEGAPPILIVNATFDPSTSMQWALEMTSQLPSAVLLIRNGYGHTTYANSGPSQVRDVIDDYLITGQTPPPNTVLPN